MKNIFLLSLITVCFNFNLEAQVSNKGQLYVAEAGKVSLKSSFVNLPTGQLRNNGEITAFNNWENNGNVDFTNNGSTFVGKTNFKGSTQQVISGANFSNLHDVVFDNSTVGTAIDLQGDISVANNAEFFDGIVSNKGTMGMFVFEQNANHTNTDDDSHVYGSVTKVGDTDFDFPIGTGTFYRSASISQPDTTADTFIGEYFLEDTNINYPTANLDNGLEFIDNTEHWTIERNSGAAQVFVKLTWDTDTTPTEILNAPVEDIRIARWDTALLTWVDQGGVQDATNQSVSALVQNYGVFTLALKKEPITTNVDFPEGQALLFPLFVTPNADGYNDTWNVNPSSELTVISLHIFDRYGKLLKQINPNGAGWDGTFNNVLMPTNDYWFVAKYKNNDEDFEREYRSNFTLKN